MHYGGKEPICVVCRRVADMPRPKVPGLSHFAQDCRSDGSIIAVSGAVLHWAHRNSAAPMVFIERHLGFSPDDGDGSMEVLVFTVLVMIIPWPGSARRLSNRPHQA